MSARRLVILAALVELDESIDAAIDSGNFADALQMLYDCEDLQSELEQSISDVEEVA